MDNARTGARPGVVVAAIAFALAPTMPDALAQDSKAAATRVVTKTLLRSAAQKECLSLTDKHKLYYRFRSDGPLNFKLSHVEDKEVVDIAREKIAQSAGSFAPKRGGDYCLVWSNVGQKSVTLHYEFQRGPRD